MELDPENKKDPDQKDKKRKRTNVKNPTESSPRFYKPKTSFVSFLMRI